MVFLPNLCVACNFQKVKAEILMQTEQLEKRFGDLAIERGFITEEQVFEAIKIQKAEEEKTGECRFIGRILLEQGLISVTQIDEILEFVGKGPALA